MERFSEKARGFIVEFEVNGKFFRSDNCPFVYPSRLAAFDAGIAQGFSEFYDGWRIWSVNEEPNAPRMIVNPVQPNEIRSTSEEIRR